MAGLPDSPTVPADDFPFVRSTIQGHVLAAGHHRALFEARKDDMQSPANQQLYARLNEQLHTVKASACFCSVFDECWETDFGPQPAKPVPRCEAPMGGR